MYISYRESEGGRFPHLTNDVRPTPIIVSSFTLLNSFPYLHRMDPFNDGDFDPTPFLEDPDVRRYLERQIDEEQFVERVLATEEAKALSWCTFPDERNILESAVDSSTSYPATDEYGEYCEVLLLTDVSCLSSRVIGSISLGYKPNKRLRSAVLLEQRLSGGRLPSPISQT